MAHQPFESFRITERLTSSLGKTGVLRSERLGREPTCHRRVLDGLHLHRVRRAITLEFRDDESTRLIQAQDVQAILRLDAARGPPTIELERHDLDAVTENL